MITGKYSYVKIYQLTVLCDAPLHIGSAVGGKEEVLVDPNTNVPFLQASGISGAMREYCKKNLGNEKAELLFGANAEKDKDHSGKLKFTDGRFDTQTLKMEYRPHVKINHKTGTVSAENGSGQKYDLEYVGAGSQFELMIYLYAKGTQDESVADFEKILAGMKDGQITFGGKKSSGSGKIRLISVKAAGFDLTDADDRRAYSNENAEFTDLTQRLPKAENAIYAYTVDVFGKTEGAVLVKGIAVNEFGENAPDAMNMQNARKEYIIPGSSIRGTIRSRMEQIADYVGNNTVIENSFGKVSGNQKDSHTGNLIFQDAVVMDNRAERILRNRIHIDKFTGGVINGGKFAEENATGEIKNLKIQIINRNEPEETLGILIYALRDLACGIVTLGSGYATGKGALLVDSVEIISAENGEKALIKLDDGKMIVKEGRNLVQMALKKANGGN